MTTKMMIALALMGISVGVFEPATMSVAWAGEPFQAKLELQGYSFDVKATDDGSINRLTIVPHGLKKQKEAVIGEIDGTVKGAEIADLDANGFPEVYVYVTSAGSGSYGSLFAYAVNKGKTMSPIYLPPITDDAKASKGYMGHDEFAVIETSLARRFPIYAEGDSNAAPSGKIRQIEYKLVAGEAGWLLRLKNLTEY